MVGDRVVGLDCFPSPGHASHHVCYLHEDGTLYAGDAAGVRIQPARYVLPVSPPPDVDVEAWFRTFEEIERRQPSATRADPLRRRRLAVRAPRAGPRRARAVGVAARTLDQEAWVAAAREPLVAAVGEDEADHWERAAPLWQSYVGMKRYWDKRVEAAARPARHRQFRLLFAGRAVSFLGNAMANDRPRVRRAGRDRLEARPRASSSPRGRFPQLVFILVGGILADRLPRNVVMVGSNLASMATQGRLAVLLLTGQRRALACSSRSPR